ncbi:MAG: nuclear transport factor 2 family protein [Oscillospiraceae bacterium]
MTLEQRIQRLEDIEAIKFVMGTYFRCLDCKEYEVDQLGACFTDDIKTEYCDGKLVLEGREQIRDFFRKAMGNERLTMHNGHTPEIDFIDDTTAIAHWYLHDMLAQIDIDRGVYGGAIYTIKYKKTNGKWQINWIGYKRTYEEHWTRSKPWDRHISENMFGEPEGD